MSLLHCITVYIESGARKVPVDAATERQQSAAFIEGDEQAIRYFFEKYQGPLFTFVLRSVHDREMAAELVQETFRRLIEKRDRLHADKGVRNYMYTIAVNLCTDYYRKQKRIMGSVDDSLLEAQSIEGRQAPRETDAVELAEMEQTLEGCIDRLPQKERTVVLLRKVDKLSFAEIADIMGASERTIQRFLRSALDRLLTDMEQHGFARNGELVW